MFFILPLGVSGLSIEDVKPHLYLNSSEVSLPLDISFIEDGVSGNYRIDNLPPGANTARYILTVEYPDQVGHSFVWGGAGSPSSVVIPVRETGLDTADLGLRAYKNGVTQSVTFASEELTPDGDYAVSGWPISSTGASWLLLWTRNGGTSWYTWTESAPVVTPSPLGSLFPGDIIRSLMPLVDSLTLGVQNYVTHEAWIGSGEGGDVYADPAQIRAVVERTNKQTMRGTTVLFIGATLTFTTSPEHALTSGGVAVDTSQITPPRTGPIDTRDRITLPDGWTAQVVDIPEGVIDPLTGRGFAPVVMLGSEANVG